MSGINNDPVLEGELLDSSMGVIKWGLFFRGETFSIGGLIYPSFRLPAAELQAPRPLNLTGIQPCKPGALVSRYLMHEHPFCITYLVSPISYLTGKARLIARSRARAVIPIVVIILEPSIALIG